MQGTAMTTQTRFRVEGMDCAACAAKIDAVVRRLPGVADVAVSVTAATMTVRHGKDVRLGTAIERKVASLGYKATAIGQAANDDAFGHHHGRGWAHDPHGESAHDHDHAGHDHAPA